MWFPDMYYDPQNQIEKNNLTHIHVFKKYFISGGLSSRTKCIYKFFNMHGENKNKFQLHNLNLNSLINDRDTNRYSSARPTREITGKDE